MSNPVQKKQDDPVNYLIEVAHWATGDIDVTVKGVASDETSKRAAAAALRFAADILETGKPADIKKLN